MATGGASRAATSTLEFVISATAAIWPRRSTQAHLACLPRPAMSSHSNFSSHSSRSRCRPSCSKCSSCRPKSHPVRPSRALMATGGVSRAPTSTSASAISATAAHHPVLLINFSSTWMPPRDRYRALGPVFATRGLTQRGGTPLPPLEGAYRTKSIAPLFVCVFTLSP